MPAIRSPWERLRVHPQLPIRAGRIDSPPGTIFHEADFDDFDFWFATHGRSTIRLQGREYPFHAGTSFLLPPRVRAGHWVEGDTDFRMAFFHFEVRIDGKVIRDATRRVTGNPPVLRLPSMPALPLFAPLAEGRVVEGLLSALRRLDDTAHLQLQSQLLHALAIHRGHRARKADSSPHGGSVLDEALQYTEANLHRPTFVADVARHVCLSPTHLTRLFRSELNESPMQALIRLRLARSRDLLLNPRLNVGEVATACGFESLSFFTRVFGRSHGCSPTAYRAQRLRKA